MAFTTETGARAGKKSKRGQDVQLKELRQFVIDFLEQNNDSLQEVFDKVKDKDPARAIELYIKLIGFVIPKPRSIQQLNQQSHDIIIDFSE